MVTLLCSLNAGAEYVQSGPLQTAHYERIGLVSVHIGDGRLGIPLDQKRSDRVIATASFPTIPAAWFEQPAVGGRLVMDLQGRVCTKAAF